MGGATVRQRAFSNKRQLILKIYGNFLRFLKRNKVPSMFFPLKKVMNKCQGSKIAREGKCRTKQDMRAPQGDIFYVGQQNTNILEGWLERL